jgi:hypothetical protein
LKVVVLAFPFRYGGYSQKLVRDGVGWIDYFRNAEAEVICVLPEEHADEGRRFLPASSEEELTVLAVPSFETCDRWRAGLSYANDTYSAEQAPYFHLWAADFDYDGPHGPCAEAASALLNYSGNEDLVVGSFESSGSKELIESAATRPLLSNWFPEESAQLLAVGVSKPRSELFRISRAFLGQSLTHRWFPSEQTIHLLLECLWSRGEYSLAALPLGQIEDDESNRISQNVVEQVDRMDLWLSYMWREHSGEWNSAEFCAKREAGFNIVQCAYQTLLRNRDGGRS